MANSCTLSPANTGCVWPSTSPGKTHIPEQSRTSAKSACREAYLAAISSALPTSSMIPLRCPPGEKDKTLFQVVCAPLDSFRAHQGLSTTDNLIRKPPEIPTLTRITEAGPTSTLLQEGSLGWESSSTFHSKTTKGMRMPHRMTAERSLRPPPPPGTGPGQPQGDMGDGRPKAICLLSQFSIHPLITQSDRTAEVGKGGNGGREGLRELTTHSASTTIDPFSMRAKFFISRSPLRKDRRSSTTCST